MRDARASVNQDDRVARLRPSEAADEQLASHNRYMPGLRFIRAQGGASDCPRSRRRGVNHSLDPPFNSNLD